MLFVEYKKFHNILKLIVETIHYYNKKSIVLKGKEITSLPILNLNLILQRYVKGLDNQVIGNIIGETRKKNVRYNIDLVSKLLINGWYDECAYNDPFVEDPIRIVKPDSEDSFNRLRFPSWRVAQAYYSIYHTTAAVVRLKNVSADSSHNLVLNSLVNHFSSELNNFYSYPFCCYLKDGNFINKSGFDYKEDEFKNILLDLYSFVKKTGKTGANINFLHIFRIFREWCNYNAGEVLILFRSKHLRDYLDINLRTIIYLLNSMNEIYLIKFLGYERVVDIFEDFYKSSLINLKFSPKTISSRFSIYENEIKKLDDSFVLSNKAKNRYRKEHNIEILNELGKSYFSKGWLFHSIKIFKDILKSDPGYQKSQDNIEKLKKHVLDLADLKSIPYKTEYFEDKSSGFIEIDREKLKTMKRIRKEKAKLLNVRMGSEAGVFFVRSESNTAKEYCVRFGTDISCNCPDFQFRRRSIKECKHIKAATSVWRNMQLS